MQENPFADLEIPPIFQASLDRHLLQLADLTKNLRSAGLDEVQVEQSVSIMVDSYRSELMRAMKTWVR